MIVLDASALVDVVTNRPAKAAVLDRVVDEETVAPAHQLTEVLSGLARMVRAGTITEATARAALDDAAALEQEHVVPNSAQLRRALALQNRICVLHGLYVALAEERGCALLTTDTRLAAAKPPCELILAE